MYFTLSACSTRPRRNFKMANSALRLIFQRSSRLIFSGSSTIGLIPSRSPEVNVSLKRQLSSFLSSNSVVQTSGHKDISCTRSAIWWKVIQGDITVGPTSCHKLGCRLHSSLVYGCSQVWILSNY